jgi:uncharacterized cofD-like protein
MKATAIGGGTGLSATMCALYGIENLEVSAVVATTDNGGSTGAIRRWADCIAWGDLRHVINELSDMTLPTLQTLLFEHRFEKSEGELGGHSLGNIILRALETIAPRPQSALDLVTHWLGITARIIPMSETPAELIAFHQGRVVTGEVEVDEMTALPDKLAVEPEVPGTKEAIVAIEEADLIVFGPGSVMTSVIPSLLVPTLVQCIEKSKAKKVWVQNLDHEEGPMGGLTPCELHQWLQQILGFNYCDLILGDCSLDLSSLPVPVMSRDLRDARDQTHYGREPLASAFRELLGI